MGTLHEAQSAACHKQPQPRPIMSQKAVSAFTLRLRMHSCALY